MFDERYEWDEEKAAANFAKHGVRFEDACEVFRDPFAIEMFDDRFDYGEDRYAIIGIAKGRMLFVAYSMRIEVIRIISARGAEPLEQRWYYEQNG